MTSVFGKGDPNSAGVKYQYGQDVGSLVRDYQRLIRDASIAAGGGVDEDAYREARRTVDAQYSNLPFEQQNQITEKLYSNLKEQGSKDRFAKIKAVAGALEGGAGVLPEVALLSPQQHEAIKSGAPWKLTREQALHRLVQEAGNDADQVRIFAHKLNPDEMARLETYMGEEQWGAPSKLQPLGWTGQIERALNFPSRLVTGGLAGAVGEARRQTADIPVGNEARVAGVPVAAALERVQGDDLFRSMGHSAWRAATRPGESDLGTEMQAAQYRYKQAAQAQALKELGPPTDQAAQSRFDARVQQLAEENVSHDYASIAVRHPEATEFVGEMALDPMNWVNPGKAAVGAARFAAKAPGMELAGRALKGLYEGSSIEKAANAFRRGAEGFKFAPELERLSAQSPELEEAASLVRMQHDKSAVAARDFGKEASGLINRMKTKTLEDEEALRAALENPAMDVTQARASLPEHLRDAFDASVELSNKDLEFQKTGSYQRWNSKEAVWDTQARQLTDTFHKNGQAAKGTFRTLEADDQVRVLSDLGKRVEFLENAGKMDEAERFQKSYNAFRKSVPKQLQSSVYGQVDEALAKPGFNWKHGTAELEASGEITNQRYVPHKYETPDVERGPSNPTLGRAQAGSTMRRAGEGTLEHRLSVADSWREHLSETLPSVQAEQVVKRLHEEVEKKGFIKEVPHITDPNGIIEAQKKFKEATGLDYVPLKQGATSPNEVGDVYKRIIGSPGDKRLTSTIFVPKDYADYVQSFRPLFGLPENAGHVDQLLKGFDNLSHGYMRLWRWMNVVPHLSSRARDILGGFGLSTIALGTKALDPVLHAKAALISFAEASGIPAAHKLAEGMTWTTRTGQKIKLSDALDIARSIGLTKQLEGHLVAPLIEGRGLAHHATDLAEKTIGQFGNIPGVRYVSPSAISAMGENYQHVVQFLGFLDDTSDLGIARALDLTSKYSGNYARMGKMERGAMRNVLGFYAWNRFIFPMMMQSLYEHPDRLAAWAKARGGLDRYFGANAIATPEGMPPYLYGHMAARAAAQPQEFIRGMMDHKAALMRTEDPLSMGFGILPALQNAVGLKVTGGGERLSEFAGPLAQMTLEAIMGRDIETGAELPPLFDFSSPAATYNSRVGQILWAPVARFTKEWKDMYDLYVRDAGKPVEAIDLMLRYRAANTLMGLDNWAARAVGAEPRTIGGMFDPLTGGTPGMITRLTDVLHPAASRSKHAIGERGLTEWTYKQTPDFLSSNKENK